MDRIVSVYKNDTARYPNKKDLFRPDTPYPEYLFKNDISSTPNDVYELVRNNFIIRKMDQEFIGTSEWNPFRNLIKSGDYVVIKPNMVMDNNPSGDGVECLYTQPSVVAAVVDYVLIALKGKGTIVIGDAPMQECNYERLISESGYDQLINYYKGKFEENHWDIRISLVDFRGFKSTVRYGVSIGSEETKTKGKVIDLKGESEFSVYGEEHLKNLRITNYNPEILAQHHQVDRHEYYISDEILKADVVINMPKPKTHRKAGVTIALKNQIGINVRKEYLPHHCVGEKEIGGDEYFNHSRLKKWKSQLQDKINYNQATRRYKLAFCQLGIRKVITFFIRMSADRTWEGSWYGNETISKTICDLNKILVYADKNGVLQESPQRKCFIVADMVFSGEKDGPIRPSTKEIGVVAMGDQPVCFDEAIATLMGMDIKKIPTLRQVRNLTGRKALVQASECAKIVSNVIQWDNKYVHELNKEDVLHFIPSDGWKGKIEL